MSFVFRLAERLADPLMLDLHAATACATSGLVDPPVPVLVGAAELVVVGAAEVLLVGAADDVLEEELPPHPAATTPIEAAARNNNSALRIISLLGRSGRT